MAAIVAAVVVLVALVQSEFHQVRIDLGGNIQELGEEVNGRLDRMESRQQEGFARLESLLRQQ